MLMECVYLILSEDHNHVITSTNTKAYQLRFNTSEIRIMMAEQVTCELCQLSSLEFQVCSLSLANSQPQYLQLLGVSAITSSYSSRRSKGM
jgi:hypothetical protein